MGQEEVYAIQSKISARPANVEILRGIVAIHADRAGDKVLEGRACYAMSWAMVQQGNTADALIHA